MSDPSMPEEGLELLLNCRNEIAAQEIRALLEAAGMPAFVFGKGGLGLNMSDEAARHGGLQVQVPAGRVEEARGILKSIEAEASEIDWDEVDVGDMPPEVADIVESREVTHAIRRFVVAAGPFLGILILVAAVAGIVIILAT